jgi:hypothetical protein
MAIKKCFFHVPLQFKYHYNLILWKSDFYVEGNYFLRAYKITNLICETRIIPT